MGEAGEVILTFNYETNHFMMLHVHEDKTDCVDLASVANDFVCYNEYSLNILGNFIIIFVKIKCIIVIIFVGLTTLLSLLSLIIA